MDGQTAASYVCKACDVEGWAIEDPPGTVSCWFCGKPAKITTRLMSDPRLGWRVVD